MGKKIKETAEFKDPKCNILVKKKKIILTKEKRANLETTTFQLALITE